MKQLAPQVKAYNILPAKAQTATASGTGLQVTPGNSPAGDAIAIANIGAVTGAPSTVSCIITVEESATVGGTYDTLATFATIATVVAAGGEISHLPVTINPAKPFIRATATISFSGGTSPAINVGVSLLVKQNVSSDSNEAALS